MYLLSGFFSIIVVCDKGLRQVSTERFNCYMGNTQIQHFI